MVLFVLLLSIFILHNTWLEEKSASERKYTLLLCNLNSITKPKNIILDSNDRRYFLGAKVTKAGLNIFFASLEKIVTFVL